MQQHTADVREKRLQQLAAEDQAVQTGRAIFRANKKAQRIDARPRTPQPRPFSALDDIRSKSGNAQAGREWDASRASRIRSENVAKSQANGTFPQIQRDYNMANAGTGHRMDDKGDISGPNDGKPMPTSTPTARGNTYGSVGTTSAPRSDLAPSTSTPKPKVTAPPAGIRSPDYKEPPKHEGKIDGMPASKWFQSTANRQGQRNAYAEPQKPKAAKTPTAAAPASPTIAEAQTGNKPKTDYSGVASPDDASTSVEKARAAADNLRNVNSEWAKSKARDNAPKPQTIQGIQTPPAFAVKTPTTPVPATKTSAPSATTSQPQNTETPKVPPATAATSAATPTIAPREKTKIFNDSPLGETANDAVDQIKDIAASKPAQAVKSVNDAIKTTAQKGIQAFTRGVSRFAADQWQAAKDAPITKEVSQNVASHLNVSPPANPTEPKKKPVSVAAK